jgi:hypothetical protein
MDSDARQNTCFLLLFSCHFDPFPLQKALPQQSQSQGEIGYESAADADQKKHFC